MTLKFPVCLSLFPHRPEAPSNPNYPRVDPMNLMPNSHLSTGIHKADPPPPDQRNVQRAKLTPHSADSESSEKKHFLLKNGPSMQQVPASNLLAAHW